MSRIGTWLSIGTLCLTVAAAGQVRAQVLEIADDGVVTTYAGPSVHTDQGAQRIAPTEAPSPQGSTPAEVSAAIQDSATRHAVPATIVEAVAWQESRFNQAARSPKGARGVMQLMPATAALLGVDASDLRGNIDGGAAYLSQQITRFGDLRLALAAYNAGPEAVQRHGGIPPYAETQSYVRAIMGRLAITAPQLLVGTGR
jgi:soluble lytic murein transglycosylase-like protein